MGAWIEIMNCQSGTYPSSGRTPRWVRGLKLESFVLIELEAMSHPTMGAWIEIYELIM